jgi:hypothetical protein
MDRAIIDRLRALRMRAHDLGTRVADDLKPFRHGKDKLTFRRRPESPSEVGDVGVTTTCSSLKALVVCRKWGELYQTESELEKAFAMVMQAPWKSSGLKESNAFTTTLVLRAFGFLTRACERELPLKPDLIHNEYPRITDKTLSGIARHLADKPDERFRINRYPATPAVIYWFTDSLQRGRLCLPLASWKKICVWGSRAFFCHLSRVSSKQEALMDPIAMAMAACLSAKLRSIAKDATLGSSPQLLAYLPSLVELKNSIRILFEEYQSSCGIWPKYFPLFHYDKQAGSNYCFTFEMLEAILSEFGSEIILEQEGDSVLRGLELALQWCYDNRLNYLVTTENEKYSGWNSGGNLETLEAGEPESWATAVVHMFLSELQEVLTDKIEELILKSFDARPCAKEDRQWNEMLDIDLQFKQTGTTRTVKELLDTEVLKGITGKNRKQFRHEPMGKNLRRSALLFGPPGTSKTELVKAIAKRLGWPLIKINPSEFLSRGLENIYSEADRVFKDLSDLSGVVVLFDEMDALVLTREPNPGSGPDITSTFLTTSMLPELADLHDKGRLIFFMTTNYQGKFDDAIKRPGRFDLLLCMWPPSWKNKLEHLKAFVGNSLSDGDIAQCQAMLKGYTDSPDVEDKLDRFTYGDMKAFWGSLCKPADLKTKLEGLQKATFVQRVNDWSQFIILNETKKDGAPSPFDRYKGERGLSRVQ